jgi:hypothetical protein
VLNQLTSVHFIQLTKICALCFLPYTKCHLEDLDVAKNTLKQREKMRLKKVIATLNKMRRRVK